MPTLTMEHFITVVLGCGVIIFYACEKGLKGILQYVLDPMLPSPSSNQMYKLSGIVAAALVLRFMSIQVTVAVSFALALGLWKAIAPLARQMLPDQALGFVLLISYCGVASVVGVVMDDIKGAIRKLFS